MLSAVRPLRETMPAEPSQVDTILRFRPSERHLHWAIAVPFLVCYSTALILVTVYNPHPTRPFRHVVSLVHRISGLCLLSLPLWTAIRHRRDAALYLHNVRQAWTWTIDDVKWLFLVGPASFFRKIALPHQGKFNAGEKVNFMTLTCTYPLLILTGLIIWFGGVPYLSWLAHFSLAVIATPLILGHIFMATVNPDTRPGLMGMITGLVDREWARHHYHHWYHEHHGHRAGASSPVADARPAPPTPCWVRVRGSALGAALFSRSDGEAAERTDIRHTVRRPRRTFAGLEAEARAAVGGGAADVAAAS